MTKFLSVAHLYFGCKMQVVSDWMEDETPEFIEPPKKGDICTLSLIQNGDFQVDGGDETECWPYGVSFEDGRYLIGWDLKSYKPILRPLSSMTEPESKEGRDLYERLNEQEKLLGEIEAKRTLFLLEKGFDLFGLIESGEAIDETTLNK